MPLKFRLEGARLVMLTTHSNPISFHAPHNLAESVSLLEEHVAAAQYASSKFTLTTTPVTNGTTGFQIRKSESRAPTVEIYGSLAPTGNSSTRVVINQDWADITFSMLRVVLLIGAVIVALFVDPEIPVWVVGVIPLVLPVILMFALVGARFHQEKLVHLVQTALDYKPNP